MRGGGRGGGTNQQSVTTNYSGLSSLILVACTANEGPVRIQYKCLVPIYVFLEMKLRGLVMSTIEL
jgi:hypothetical protein